MSESRHAESLKALAAPAVMQRLTLLLNHVLASEPALSNG